MDLYDDDLSGDEGPAPDTQPDTATEEIEKILALRSLAGRKSFYCVRITF
jgi:hypothetical protein